jgi:putative SOS response-associated peptidase YedK
MCSRYSLTAPPEAVRAVFQHVNAEPFPPRYNIAPSQPVLIVRHNHARQREITLVRWGLIPSWVKDPSKRAMPINVRAETAAERASFRGALRHKRCLVPADAFYAWKGAAGKKSPYMMRPFDGQTMGLAGLWEHWLGADGSEIETMAIITVPANRSLGRIHDRMPAILRPDQFEAWLDTSSGRSGEAEKMLVAVADDHLELAEVGTRLNDSRSEGPELQEIVRKMLL